MMAAPPTFANNAAAETAVMASIATGGGAGAPPPPPPPPPVAIAPEPPAINAVVVPAAAAPPATMTAAAASAAIINPDPTSDPPPPEHQEHVDQNSPDVITNDANLLRQYLLDCPHISQHSPVMVSALDGVALQKQRAELGLVLGRVRTLTDHAVAGAVACRGVNEEIKRLDGVIDAVSMCARGKAVRLARPPDDGTAGLSAKEAAARRKRRRMTSAEEAEAAVAMVASGAGGSSGGGGGGVGGVHMGGGGTGTGLETSTEVDTNDPSATRVGVPVPGHKVTSVVNRWFIAGKYRRVTPTWDFPKGSARTAWIKWCLPDPDEIGVPPMRELRGADVSHLKRGADNLNDLKVVMTEIENEVKRQGLWSEEIEEDDVYLWYDACGVSALHKHFPPPKKDAKRKRKSVKRENDELSWTTLVTYIRRTKKLERDAARMEAAEMEVDVHAVDSHHLRHVTGWN